VVKRGDVHWAAIDKRRPVLILSPDDRNELATDVVVAIISMQGGHARWNVRLGRKEAGLPPQSYVKCEQIQTTRKEFIDRSAIGSLSAARMHEVERALLLALHIDIARHA